MQRAPSKPQRYLRGCSRLSFFVRKAIAGNHVSCQTRKIQLHLFFSLEIPVVEPVVTALRRSNSVSGVKSHIRILLGSSPILTSMSFFPFTGMASAIVESWGLLSICIYQQREIFDCIAEWEKQIKLCVCVCVLRERERGGGRPGLH